MIDELSAFPETVKEALAAAKPDLRTRASDGRFAMVEHLCHLGDVEREAYGARIERLLSEEESLEWDDFDGDAVARERNYLEQDADAALQRFIDARAANIARLRAVQGDQWQRRGMHRGVGEVTLARLTEMMLQHDRDHAADIKTLLKELGR
jgi:DinB superfamily